MTEPERMQVGDGLFVMVLDIASVKEADINAQQMQPKQFDRLTENIRIRGQIESLPYVHWPNFEGTPEIVSGHHRTRAARAAGLTRIPFLVDTNPMTRSQVVAKQIAHNELHGEPDQNVLAQLVAMMDNVDDMLMSGLDETKLPALEPDDTALQIPHADFDWRLVQLMFLPRNLDNLEGAIKAIDPGCDMVGLAERDQFAEFSRAMMDYGRAKNIKSMATVISKLTDLARREIEAAKEGASDE